jgi:hypothetical protein
MEPNLFQSYLSRSTASYGAIVARAGLETKPPPLQVARVLRDLQATAGLPVTLAVDDTVHLQLDETLLTNALATLLDYAAEHGAETLVLRLSSEEPGVVLELDMVGTRLASQMWQELQIGDPHPTLGRAANAFREMQAKLELEHTGEASASVVILFSVQRVSCTLAAE